MTTIDKDGDLERKRAEWIKKMKEEGKLKNPTEEHRIAWKTMQNKKRREIIAFIGGGKSLKEIKEAFNLDDLDANIHLGMLENALYIEKFEKKGDIYFILTPLAEEYLSNKLNE